MTLRISLGIATAVALATAGAYGQTGPESTGALPPVDAPAPTATESPSVAPAPTPAPTPAPAPTAAQGPGQQPTYPGYPQPAYAPQPQPAWGYPPPPPQRPPPPPVRDVSLTFSPLHLIFPIIEVTGEVRVVDHFGIAALGGYGTVSADTASPTGSSQRFDAYELGGQLICYPSHEFDGLEVGAEFLYVNVSADDIDQSSVSGVGIGWALGPMVGYKLITEAGFTFVAQGGLQYVKLSAQASDNTGTSTSEEDSRWLPLVNLNIGWSL